MFCFYNYEESLSLFIMNQKCFSVAKFFGYAQSSNEVWLAVLNPDELLCNIVRGPRTAIVTL